MSLFLAPLTFLLGLGVLAGVLYLLQRLRVRHQQRRVITTLFWKEALEETRARVFFLRFRHFLAYLLLLTIAGLLWLGFARPEVDDSQGRQVVFLLDGSAGMAWGDRFAESVEALEEAIHDVPRSRRSVLFCGGSIRTLLAPGEESLLLERRLEGVSPESCLPTIEQAVRQLSRVERTSSTSLVIVGDTELDPAVEELLPEGFSLERITPSSGSRAGNRGITALGVTPAGSGRWDRVDVLVEVRGTEVSASESLASTLGDRALEATVEAELVPDPEGPRGRFVIRDVPARGELLVVRLARGDAFPGDDEARLVIPVRRLVRVALSESLRPLLEPVLTADPALVIATDDVDVAVRRLGESVGGDVPALEFGPPAQQDAAFLLRHEPELVSSEVLVETFDRLGLEDVDALELAEATGRVIRVSAEPAPRRGIAVWDVLLSDRYDFVQGKSFPLFVALSVRWLAGVRDSEFYTAVGSPVPGTGPVMDENGRTLDPAGLDFVPRRAGEYRTSTDEPIAASLLDPGLVAGGISASEASGLGAGGGGELVTWLLLLAFLLVFVEWFLFRSGRIP